jgi:hypothetical protein
MYFVFNFWDRTPHTGTYMEIFDHFLERLNEYANMPTGFGDMQYNTDLKLFITFLSLITF